MTGTNKTDLAGPSPRRYGPPAEPTSNYADAVDRESSRAHGGLDSLGVWSPGSRYPSGIEHVVLSSRTGGTERFLRRLRLTWTVVDLEGSGA